MGTSRFVINEASCYHAPPSKVLDVGIVGDLVFLAICDNSEPNHNTTTTVIREEIMVDVNTLILAIQDLANHQDRAEKRRESIEEKRCCQELPPKKSRKKSSNEPS